MKKSIKLKSFFTSKLFYFLLIIIFPICVHIAFKITVPENFPTAAVWDSPDILEYGGSIISSLIIYLTVILTLSKTQEENKKTIINSQNEKKFEKYTESLSTVMGLLIKTNLPNFYYQKRIIMRDEVEKVFEDLETNIDNLAIAYAALQISLQPYNRKYFVDKLRDEYTNFISQYKIYLIEFKNKKLKYFDPNGFFAYTTFDQDFNNLSQNAVSARMNFINKIRCIGFAISDYYFDKNQFMKQESTNENSSYNLDTILKDYEPLYVDMVF